MEIKVRWGERAFAGKPDAVYREISSIGKEVKPEEIVSYAKNNTESELHKCFTWDDTEAAEKWRIQEARFIVCNLKISYIKDDADKKPKMVRAMLRTDIAPDAGYKQTVEIVQNKDEYAGMLAVAKMELHRFERKYSMLTELEPVFEAIRKLG